jgi:Dyp-type peroxidase family
LGYSLTVLKASFKEEQKDVAFTAGMVAAQRALNDPDRSTWDQPYKLCLEQPIHAMVVLAADSETMLDWVSARVGRSLSGVGEIAGREVGAALRDEKNRSVEPFGFADGISQPLFFQEDLEREKKRGGNGPWDPSAPLELVLIADPFTKEQDCFGSFLVFRKLEQNVKGFREKVRRIARTFTGGDEELAGAFVVGRFRNGTPVIAHRSASDADHDFNNFDYFQDPNGVRCPFHAHTRKTNPRGVSSGPAVIEERRHRIVRRGVPYDSRQVQEGEAEEGVGLLFLCFQADIGNQFAVVQAWANDPDSPILGATVDPLIGRGSQGQSWRTAWDTRQDGTFFNFGQSVTLKGGEFFFAPSIPFLRSL